jgi:hypothetical protein
VALGLARVSTLALLLLIPTLVGCGSSGGKKASRGTSVAITNGAATTSTTPELHELAQTFLRIVGPANAAITTFGKKAKRWTTKTTYGQAVNDAAPLIAALEKTDNALLRVHWPSSIAVDVKALVTGDGAVIGDLKALDSLTFRPRVWVKQFPQDVGKLSSAAHLVRADLGLPPSP